MIPRGTPTRVSILPQGTEGEIGPFSSVRVPITFRPVVPGEVEARFKVVFTNPLCPTVSAQLPGTPVLSRRPLPRARRWLVYC